MLHATSRAAEDRPDSPPTPALRHGARELPGVSVEDYNAELKDGGGFVGDRARRDAFLERLEDWRRRAADPWPGQSLAELGKERLQQALEEGSPIEMGILLAAIVAVALNAFFNGMKSAEHARGEASAAAAAAEHV